MDEDIPRRQRRNEVFLSVLIGSFSALFLVSATYFMWKYFDVFVVLLQWAFDPLPTDKHPWD